MKYKHIVFDIDGNEDGDDGEDGNEDGDVELE